MRENPEDLEHREVMRVVVHGRTITFAPRIADAITRQACAEGLSVEAWVQQLVGGPEGLDGATPGSAPNPGF